MLQYSMKKSVVSTDFSAYPECARVRFPGKDEERAAVKESMKEELTFKGILALWLRHWHVTLCCVLALGALLGGYKFFSSLSLGDAVAQNKAATYEAYKRSLEAQRDALYAKIQDYDEYYTNSQLRKVDPYVCRVTRMSLGVQSDTVNLYEVAFEDVNDPSNQILRGTEPMDLGSRLLVQYQKLVTNAPLAELAAGLSCGKIEERYLKEIVNVTEVEDIRGVLEVEIYNTEDVDALPLMNAIFAYLQSMQTAVVNASVDHRLVRLETTTFDKINTNMIARHREMDAYGTVFRTDLDSTITKLNTLTPPSNGRTMLGALKNGVMWGAAGAVGGLVLGLFVALLGNAADDRLHTNGEAMRLLGLPALGTAETAKSLRGIGRWAARIAGDAPPKDSAAAIAASAAILKQRMPEGTLLLTGTAEDAALQAAAEKLREAGAAIEAGPDPRICAETTDKLGAASAAVLLVVRNKTRLADAKMLCAHIEASGKKILGYIMA